jgi:hypothetical protein
LNMFCLFIPVVLSEPNHIMFNLCDI